MMKFVSAAYSKWKHLPRIGTIIAVIMAIVALFRPPINFPATFTVLSVFIGLDLALWAADKYDTTRGPIIDGEKLLYKGLWTKSLNFQEIVAIKVTRASISYKYSSMNLLKGNDGNQLYSMFLLKNYMPWAMNEKEGQEMTCDMEFSTWGREYIICRLVYDQEAIDHLLRLNPNIVVF